MLSPQRVPWTPLASAAGTDPGWPFLPSAPFARALQRLLAAVQGLPLAGWESSCRLWPGGLRSNRMLLGLEPAGIAPQRLLELPQALGMPTKLAQAFLQELSHSRRILLALEQAGGGVEFKAYHELKTVPDDHEDPLPEALVMRGRKWRDASANSAALRCTDYLRPGLGPEAWRRGLRSCPGMDGPARPALELLSHLMAWPCVAQAAPDLLVATEAPSQRLSYCLRLYASGLRLQALRPLMPTLMEAWGLSPGFLDQLPSQRRLGWLAAGTDAAGNPFLTLYAESSLAEARLAIDLGALDEQHQIP